MNLFRMLVMCCVVCPLSACAFAEGDDALDAPEPSEDSSLTLSVEALQAFSLPSILQIRDTTKDDGPTVVYTREGFIFRLSLTHTGADLSIENAANAPLRVGSYQLTADCEGGRSQIMYFATEKLTTNGYVRCRDGAVPSLASVEFRALASSASDIAYRLPAPSSPGNANFSFSGFPGELYAGDGSSAAIVRVDANAVVGTFTNRTGGAVGVRVVLEGACPEARFDEPLVYDSGTQRVLPGASLDTVMRCLNGVPTPALSVRSWPWSAALGASPEVTNVSP